MTEKNNTILYFQLKGVDLITHFSLEKKLNKNLVSTLTLSAKISA